MMKQQQDLLTLIQLSVKILRQSTLSKFKLFKQLFWSEVFCLVVFTYLFFTDSPFTFIFQWAVIVLGGLAVLAIYFAFRFHHGEKIKELFILEDQIQLTTKPTTEQLTEWNADIHSILTRK